VDLNQHVFKSANGIDKIRGGLVKHPTCRNSTSYGNIIDNSSYRWHFLWPLHIGMGSATI
jgi:hypothetical protein